MYVPFRKRKRRRSRLHLVRTTVAGVAAAGVWAAGEPWAAKALHTDYSDARLLGALVTRGDHWREAGWGIHAANGALFGFAFGYLGLHGWKQGLLAAEAENLMLWPAMAVMDEFHPDRKDGTWRPLVNDPRVFAQEVLTHGVFGATLGLLAGHPEPRPLRARLARLSFLLPFARRAARKRVKRAYTAQVERVTERLPEWEKVTEHIPEWDKVAERLPDWEKLAAHMPEWQRAAERIPEWEKRAADHIPEWDKVAAHLPDVEKWAARLPEVEKLAREYAHARNN